MDEYTRKNLGVDEDKPTEWFESLYLNSNEEGTGIPWANMAPHPLFKSWMSENKNTGNGKTALVVGCGMGDDAIELESNGFAVTAFDVSNSAIELCKRRFPKSKVEFIQYDLLQENPAWYRKFDFVLEIFTIQALPPKYEATLVKNISDFVSDDGRLIVIAEIQKERRIFDNGPPWLLNDEYKKSFENCGLKQIFHSSNSEAEIGEEIHLTIFERKL